MRATRRLSPARFVALYELSVKAGPTGVYDKRTVSYLLDSGLIEWAETTKYYEVYRATSRGVDAVREHLDWLAEREAAERVYRHDTEMYYQVRPDFYRQKLDEALAPKKAEVTAPAPVTEEPGPFGVFEAGLCIASHSSRAVAEQLADEARAADDGDSEVVVWPLCLEHPDAEQPRRTCEECTTDGADEDTETEPALSGEVITHQNTGRGVAPEHAADEHARAAVDALTAAGHTPADVADDGTATTGFKAVPRGDGAVYIYHLQDGDDRQPETREHWIEELCDYADTLHAAGWAIVTIDRCLRAMRPGTVAGALYGAQAPTPAPIPVPVADGTATLGSEPSVADHPDVRAVVAALVADGHTPAPLTGQYDDQTCTSTGFFVHPTGEGLVYVYHLENGQMYQPVYQPGDREWWTAELNGYRATLNAATGWRTHRPSAYLRAERTTPDVADEDVRPVHTLTRAAIAAEHADDVDMLRVCETLSGAGSTPVMVVHTGDERHYEGTGFAITPAPGDRIRVVPIVDGAPKHARTTVKYWARLLPDAGFVVHEQYGNALILNRPQRQNTAPLPHRAHPRPARIAQASGSTAPALAAVGYLRSFGWEIDGNPFADMAHAVDYLENAGHDRKTAFEAVARAQMDVMNADLEGAALFEDTHVGGYGFRCLARFCPTRVGAYDYPGGALWAARAHLRADHPGTLGLPITDHRYQ